MEMDTRMSGIPQLQTAIRAVLRLEMVSLR